MEYLWATLLVLLNAVWLATVVAGLPGLWLMVAGAIALEWWRGDQQDIFSAGVLIAIVVLAAAAEIAEFVTGMVGSQKAGGTRWGSVGALVGGLVGAVVGSFVIPIPLVGTLIGACGGAAIGAAALELATGRKFGESAKSGVGAGVGTLAGRVIKLAVGALIWIIIAVAAYWP